ncbi:MAG: DNA/RNA nuclease SfsA [Asticcacaulis sp.]
MIVMDGLIKGRLLSRYKRFFADIDLSSGETVTAHCPNPGKMMGLLHTGTEALVTHINDPAKKLQYRLEALKENGVWVGVNTQWPNRLIGQAINDGIISELSGYASVRPEVKYGQNSRIDFLGQGHAHLPDAYIEVKNVHLMRTAGKAEFPDCVTTRGAKHLHELAEMVAAGYRAVVVFCVQRDDCQTFDVAADLDSKFAESYRLARAQGVEVIALSFGFSEQGLAFSHRLEVL